MDVSRETTQSLHPSILALLRFFDTGHLPRPLAAVAQPFSELAYRMAYTLPSSPEVTVGIRKLLEAKDCAVRAALPLLPEPSTSESSPS